LVVGLAFASAGGAAGRDVLAALFDLYQRAEAAGASARGGVAGADAVQLQYDAARDLEEALAGVEPLGASCRLLVRALRAFARGNVAQAEAFDRHAPLLAARGRQRADRARRLVEEGAPRCRPGGLARRREVRLVREPGPGEAFFGRVRARAPLRADEAVLVVEGREVGRSPLVGGRSRFQVGARLAPGRYDLEVRFLRDGRPVARARVSDVWLLPRSAQVVDHRPLVDTALSRRLEEMAEAFSGIAGLYVHDLRRRRQASWNAHARFPAASTVKLGVLIAALARFGPGSPYRYDLGQLALWSSNLATNRVVRALGDGSTEKGSAVVARTLRAAGAESSTFTGSYRAGTSLSRPAAEPPLVSPRVTTAGDLAALIETIHAAAVGDPSALERTKLTSREARLALALLLSSEDSGENRGLLRPFIPSTVLVARKEGWLSNARHTVAIVYTERGPVVFAITTFRPGLSLGEAQRLGRALLEAARIR